MVYIPYIKKPIADAFIIDGAVLISEKSPGTARTFDDYAKDVIIPTLQSYSRHYYRTDIDFDIYTMHNKFSNFLCFASLCAHLFAMSNKFECNDENRILGNRGQSLILEPALPSPKQWDWKEDDHNWQPHWTSLPTVAACCQELAKCGCKKRSRSGNC